MSRSIECEEPAILLGTFRSRIVEYAPEEEEEFYNDLIEQMGITDSASMLLEDFSLFQKPNFIRIIERQNPPQIDITLCLPELSTVDIQEPSHTPLELILKGIEDGYSDPQQVREIVLEALKTGSLTLQVIPEGLDVPQSIILSQDRFFPTRKLFMKQMGEGKFWFLPNPLGLANRYLREHQEHKRKAVVLTP